MACSTCAWTPWVSCRKETGAPGGGRPGGGERVTDGPPSVRPQHASLQTQPGANVAEICQYYRDCPQARPPGHPAHVQRPSCRFREPANWSLE
eukprot:scaffold619_cov403-Prasinococcus_capsulatus_cf.AAC.10